MSGSAGVKMLDYPLFSHMFDGEAGEGRNNAGLIAKDARWRSASAYDTGGVILVPGKNAQPRPRRRISGYVEESRAEDAAWNEKRPPDVEEV